jgi:hypothetical protein
MRQCNQWGRWRGHHIIHYSQTVRGDDGGGDRGGRRLMGLSERRLSKARTHGDGRRW